VSEERFREALGKGKNSGRTIGGRICFPPGVDAGTLQREKGRLPDRLLVQEDSRAVFVPVKEISWVEADRNYVLLHRGNKTHTLRSTLDAGAKFTRPQAVRAHQPRNDGAVGRHPRSCCRGFHGEYKVVLHDNTELRWSRRYVSQRPELLKLP